MGGFFILKLASSKGIVYKRIRILLEYNKITMLITLEKQSKKISWLQFSDKENKEMKWYGNELKEMYKIYPFWKLYKNFLQTRDEKYSEFVTLRPWPKEWK